MQKQEMELYFHIPFCVSKCFYCDFLSAPADTNIRKQYMEALLRETRGRAGECADFKISSIFIGGGTPSLLEAYWIEELLKTVREKFQLLPEAEITIECNPGTVELEKLRRYRQAGINRLSIGLQSADDGELAAIGRIHTWQQFQETWKAAELAGIDNLNVDLMSALPGQTTDSCRKTLQKVLTLQPAPKHISAYSLIVEEGTRFGELAEQGRLQLPSEEEERQMYYETGRILQKAGYQRYEISNYALAGYECRHNCGYWRRIPYLGLGLGAASLMDNRRFHNGTDLMEYVNSPLEYREDEQILSIEEQMEEFLFLGLRMTDGVRERAFWEVFHQELTAVYGEVISKNRSEGLLCYREKTSIQGAGLTLRGQQREDKRQMGKDRYLALTERGLDLSNYVMAQFLLDRGEANQENG